jgi:multisubunit Na+/H+ antiporter MnhE subunit
MKIEDILFIAFLTIAIILFLWLIFGGSPTIEQVLLALLLSFVIRVHGDIKEVKGRLNEHLRGHKKR